MEGPISDALDLPGNLSIGEYTRFRKVGRISTFAGTGTCEFSGDGMPEIEAEFDMPQLSYDGVGNLWFLNHFQPCLRIIDSSGVMRRIVGTGDEGQIPEDGSLAREVTLCGVPLLNSGNSRKMRKRSLPIKEIRTNLAE